GIAKILENDNSDIHTTTGQFLGTAQYTSPEQASGSHIDHRSDIYCVGVLLYELLTGARPFAGPVHQLIFGHLYSPPPPFADRVPPVSVPPEVEEVVFRCLAKKPDERPQSALAVSEAFSTAVFGVSSPPAPRPDSWSVPVPNPVASPGSVRSAALPATEKASQVGEHAAPPPGTPTPQPAGKDPANDDDWESPPTPTTFPVTGKRSRRTWIVLAVLVVAVLAPACLLLGPLLLPGPRVPPGYRAENPHDTVNGLPRILVRKPDGPRFIRIEGGDFLMGDDDNAAASGADDDQPAHPVTLSGYYMQATEVTNGEMEAYFVAEGIARENRPKRWLKAVKEIEDAGFDPRRYPAVGIPHELAERFARFRGGRLPTEAQWEYAARSRGQKRRYVWGDAPVPDLTLANIDSMGMIGSIHTIEVGKMEKDRTDQGIMDLTGNVREWCRDFWAAYPSSPTPFVNPQGAPASEEGKGEPIVRGGSFATYRDNFRTTRPRRPLKGDTSYWQVAEDGTSEDLGFRIVLEWPRPSPSDAM
ncbi:MAG: SUMF1/EgtB/PvdO family nonheme iron enzyme, partial [Singulisphaera sp.]